MIDIIILLLWEGWPLWLLFLVFILSGLNYFKLYNYLKKKRPDILKTLLRNKPKFLPEFMRYKSWKLIPFLLNIKEEDGKELNRYKIKYIIYIILVVILFFLSFYWLGRSN